jgi:hypothetical protein
MKKKTDMLVIRVGVGSMNIQAGNGCFLNKRADFA